MEKIALIFGDGELPKIIVKKFLADKRDFCVVRIKGESIQESNDFNSIEISIFEIGKLIDYLKLNNVKKIVFAGNIKRPSFFDVRFDSMARKLIANIMKKKILGDDSILKSIIIFFESLGFEVLSQSDLLGQDTSLECSICFDQVQNKSQIESDIKIGFELLLKISDFDVGQSLIVENSCVIGIEGVEGTDELIRRLSPLRRRQNKSGVLVKTIKTNQTLKVDAPVIGVNTIENLAKHGFAGLAICKNVLLINKFEIINAISKNDMFLYLHK